MNKNIFTWMAAICCILLFQSATITIKTEMGKPEEKIKLREITNKTRSATVTQVNAYTQVSAYTDGETLTVDVENYTGDVHVQVVGAGGAVQLIFTAYSHGTGTLDISSLPQGVYTVSILLNSTYEGTFVK